MSVDHPLDSLADRYGDRSAALLLAVAVVLPVVLLPTDHPAGPMLIGLAVVCYATSDGLHLGDDGETEVERAKRRYVVGDIGLDEFESRVDVLVDDRKQEMRGLAETVNGVGPATSLDIADHFESVDALKRARPDDLEEIHGVGSATAEKIATEIGPYGGEEPASTPDMARDPLASTQD